MHVWVRKEETFICHISKKILIKLPKSTYTVNAMSYVNVKNTKTCV